MELITKLGIDWKLLVTQIINFFVLLFVLYRFVYRPVLESMEKRSKMIEKGVHDAKKSEEKLQEIERLRDQKMAETEKEIGRLFEKAKKDAESVKQELIVAANSQAEDLLRRSKLQIEEQQQKMVEEVKAEVTVFIVKAAAKILEREFNENDQKKLVNAISQEMKSV